MATVIFLIGALFSIVGCVVILAISLFVIALAYAFWREAHVPTQTQTTEVTKCVV